MAEAFLAVIEWAVVLLQTTVYAVIRSSGADTAADLSAFAQFSAANSSPTCIWLRAAMPKGHVCSQCFSCTFKGLYSCCRGAASYTEAFP